MTLMKLTVTPFKIILLKKTNTYLKAIINPMSMNEITKINVMTILQSVLFTHFSPLNPHSGSALGGLPPGHGIGRLSL